MADSLFDILAHRDFSEPTEMAAIKEYIHDHFQTEAEVITHEFEIIIVVPSASLAGVLRFHVRKIQAAAQTKKRLIIRIR
jgi:hypothetical protein